MKLFPFLHLFITKPFRWVTGLPTLSRLPLLLNLFRSPFHHLHLVGEELPICFPQSPSLIQSCDYTLKEGKIGKPEHLRCDSCLKVWRQLSWNPCTPLVFKSSLLVPSSPHGSKVSKYHTFEKRPLKPDLSFALPYFKGIVLCVCSKKVKRIFNDIKIWWK